MGLCVLYYVEYSLYNVKKVGFFFYLGWNFTLSMKINKGQTLQRYDGQSYGTCALHFSLMRSIHLCSFKMIPEILLELQKYDGQSYDSCALHLFLMRSIHL